MINRSEPLPTRVNHEEAPQVELHESTAGYQHKPMLHHKWLATNINHVKALLVGLQEPTPVPPHKPMLRHRSDQQPEKDSK